MRTIRANAFFVIFFGALFLFFLWPLLALVRTFSLGDYHAQFYPWSFDYAREIAAGRFPFWTNLMTNGFPMVAEGQVGPYYPLHLLTYLALPFRVAYTWSIPFHILVGGIGAYAYGRKTGLGKEGATLAAVVFSFSSAYGGCFYTSGTLRVLTWLPWALVLVERAGKKEWPWLTVTALLSATVGLMWTAGFPQLALYAALYLLLYGTARFRGSPRVLGAVIAAHAAGLALALPQVLSTLELAAVSVRAGQGADFALWGSVPPPAAVSLAYPEWGKLVRVSFYAGIAPFFLAAAACFLPKRVQEKTHLFLAVFFLLLAFGKYNPIFSALISKLPAPAMRNPSKFLFFTVISLGFTAGWMLDRLREGGDAAVTRRIRKVFAVLALAAALAPGVAGLAFHALDGPIAGRAHAMADRTFLAKKDPVHERAYYHAVVDETLARARRAFSYANPWTAYAAAMALLVGAVLVFGIGATRRRERLPAIVAVFVVADLALFGHFLGTGFVGNAGAFPREKDLLATHFSDVLSDDGLFVEFASDASKEAYEPNFSMLYELPHAGGYSPLLIRRYYELAKDLGIADGSLGRPPYSAGVWRAQRGVIDALGITHVLSDVPLDLEGFRLEEKISGRYLYRNGTAVPVAYATYGWRAIPHPAERLAYLKSADFLPARVTVVEKTLPASSSASGLDTRWLGTEHGSLRTTARAEFAGDAVVVFRTTYYPRWKGLVDGRPAEVFPVNHAFCGLFVSKGIREATLYYDLTPHVVAQRVAMVAWLAVLLACVFPLWRRRGA